MSGPLWVDPIQDPSGYYRCAIPCRLTSGTIMRLEQATALLAQGRPVRDWAGVPTIVRFGEDPLGAFVPLVAALRAAGVPTWLDIDDHFGAAPPDFLIRVSHEHTGLRLPDDAHWRGVMARAAAEERAAFTAAMTAATGVIATTRALAAVARWHTANVVVLPNCIDLRDAPATPPRPVGRLRIGFAASHFHHIEDRDLYLPALLDIARRPEVELHYFGGHPRYREGPACWPGGTYALGGVRYHFHPGMAFPRFLEAIGILDIAIAPRVDTPLNRCRSAVRWIEHSLHGTPMVVSDIPPFGPVAHGRTGFKVRTADEFHRYLLRLVEDAALRRRIGEAARAEVLRAHTPAAVIDRWRAFVAGAADRGR